MFLKRKLSKLEDDELLRCYAESGLTDYFGELYNRYIPLLYGVCLKYLQDADRAQDAVMEIFEELLPRISNYEINVFRTWIYSVARNHCLQLLRKENKEIPIDFGINVMESDDVLHLFNDDDSSEEQLQALKHCMEQLPEPQRISITQFFLEELSYADVAEKSGYSLKGVKSYIQNGRRNLSNCIKKRIG